MAVSQSTKVSPISRLARLSGRGVGYFSLAIFLFFSVQTAIEPFHIPSGSMAPALRGHHRVCTCPRCGHEIAVGRATADVEDAVEPRFYRKAFCPNCGLFPAPITDSSPARGDRVVVNKTAFLVRSPERWEMVVFRLLGEFFIKRVLGLPGDEVLLKGGDLYVNGRLSRKTLAEARAMGMLVFDQEHAPAGGWGDRWESFPPKSIGGERALLLDGLATPHTVTYRHFSLDARKCEPIRDEYAYNGGVHADSTNVHDFLIETEVEAVAGQGSLTLMLCDGCDQVEVRLPVGVSGTVAAHACLCDRPDEARCLTESEATAALRIGRRYRVEFAFVDRRVHLAVDGRLWLSADLPETKDRPGVERPFKAQANGVQAAFHRFRLYRDLHYTQQGNNAVRGKAVRLGPNQYFMLGDNSPTSEDSRFWPDEGRVDAACLYGSVLLVKR